MALLSSCISGAEEIGIVETTAEGRRLRTGAGRTQGREQDLHGRMGAGHPHHRLRRLRNDRGTQACRLSPDPASSEHGPPEPPLVLGRPKYTRTRQVSRVGKRIACDGQHRERVMGTASRAEMATGKRAEFSVRAARTRIVGDRCRSGRVCRPCRCRPLRLPGFAGRYGSVREG